MSLVKAYMDSVREQAGANRMERLSGVPGNRALVEKIIGRMKASPEGSLRFRDYMEMCLYDPDGGYYTRDRPKIGREGDFYTSSHIGSILGDVLARYIAGLAETRPGTFTVTEWGAGTGRLALQILDRLQTEATVIYDRLEYCIVERSAYHRSRLEHALDRHRCRVSLMASAPETAYGSGLLFSNELLDAFPVHRIRRRGQDLMELWVGWDPEEGRFFEQERPCIDTRLTDYLEQGSERLADGQTAEVNLDAETWIGQQAGRLDAVTPMLTIDYGDVAAELFGPHRMAGTLMCYKDHRAYDNPYIFAGEQDITAHVDFSSCIRAGIAGGLGDWKLMTQKQFLVDHGILNMLEEHGGRDPFSPAAKRNRSIRQILLSDSMSELFKVLIQRK